MNRTVNAAAVVVTNRKAAVNDAARPWLVINENRGEVIGRYESKAKAESRANAIRKRGTYRV